MYLVQIIAILVYLAVIGSAIFVSYRKTVIAWVPLSLLFNQQVCILYSPAIALTLATNATLIGLFFVFLGKIKSQPKGENFALWPFYICMFISIGISTVMSDLPINLSVNSIVKTYVIGYSMVYVFYRCLLTPKDIKLFVKVCLIIAAIITVDGIIEALTHVNIAGDFIYRYSPQTDDLEGRTYYVPYFVSEIYRQRYGMARCYSFFNLHITFGMTCAMLFFLISNFRIKKWSYNIGNPKMKSVSRVYLIISALLLVGIVCSNSKTPLIGLLIFLLAFYQFKSLFKTKVFLGFILAFLAVIIFVPQYFNNILSLFDQDIAAEDGGSTVMTRAEQLQYILILFKQSPIWGNGINAAGYYSRNVYGFDGILGAESIWFKLLADQGIIGCIAYMVKYISFWSANHNIIPKRILLFYLLSILAMETATGGASLLLTSAIFFVLRKQYRFVKKVKEMQKSAKLESTPKIENQQQLEKAY